MRDRVLLRLLAAVAALLVVAVTVLTLLLIDTRRRERTQACDLRRALAVAVLSAQPQKPSSDEILKALYQPCRIKHEIFDL
jgi:hypothetical protein